MLILLVLATGWDRGSGTVSASTAAAVPEAGGSCPLTSAQKVASAKAWKKMMPVLRHPRCLNCHGGIPDPLPGKGGATRKHSGVVDMDSTDTEKVCEDCHQPGWRTAGHKWIDLSDREICSSMKFQFSSAQFIDHIVRDGGGTPFIELAFAGLRGLNDGAGKSAMEDDLNRPLTPEPPPGSHAELIQQANAWVRAQGGRFVGDDNCGCAADELEIHFRSALTIVEQRSASHPITSTITGEGSVVLNLGPELTAPEWELATGVRGDTASLTWSGISISEPTGCNGQVVIMSSPDTKFNFWLGMSSTPEPKLSLEIIPGVDLHRVVNRCRLPNGTTINSPYNDPISIFSGAWAALHGPAAGAAGISAADLLKAPAANAKAAGVPDMSKLMAMDPKAMAAMMESMKGKPPAEAAAEMTKFINQMIPGASQMVAAAKSNLKFAIPDAKWCTVGTGTPFLALCNIEREVTSGGGLGSTLTITEKTTITIGKPKP